MARKIFKGVWFFSLLALIGVFFYVYASLQENVVFSNDVQDFLLSRDTFFYLAIIIYAFVNSLVFFIGKLITTELNGFHSWFYGLVITLNCFFIATLSYLFVVNGQDSYDYQKLGPAMYGSLMLVVVWLFSWPLYYIFKKIFIRQAA